MQLHMFIEHAELGFFQVQRCKRLPWEPFRVILGGNWGGVLLPFVIFFCNC